MSEHVEDNDDVIKGCDDIMDIDFCTTNITTHILTKESKVTSEK